MGKNFELTKFIWVISKPNSVVDMEKITVSKKSFIVLDMAVADLKAHIPAENKDLHENIDRLHARMDHELTEGIIYNGPSLAFELRDQNDIYGIYMLDYEKEDDEEVDNNESPTDYQASAKSLYGAN